jgi:dihydroflavonol-4-reductase
MRIFVTGATGFVTGRVTKALVARGDDVRALVRDVPRAAALATAGVTLVAGDLLDAGALRRGMDGVDGVIHGAAVYEVGIASSRRPAMYAANVTGTERVLDAALAARVPRVVYISTCAIFGNTHGAVVDESYTRTGPYTSYYEETKVRAHEVAVERAARGLSVTLVQPGGVYGPGDSSQLGGLMQRFVRAGLPLIAFADAGLSFVHVDDLATGIIAALDRGAAGRSYILGGDNARVVDAFAALARISGRRAPGTLPYWPIELAALARPQLRELITTAKGVTFWATSARAKGELGYSARGLEPGLRDTYGTSAAGLRSDQGRSTRRPNRK